MKNILICLLMIFCSTNIFAQQNQATRVVLQPKNPIAGQPLKISYTPRSGNAGGKLVKLKLRQLIESRFRDTIVNLEYLNNNWDITVKIDPAVSMLSLAFSVDTVTDVNDEKGYLYPVYVDEKTSLRGTFSTISSFYHKGMRQMGVFPDTARAMKYLEEEFSHYPQQKYRLFPTYVKLLLDKEQKTGVQKVEQEIKLYEKRAELTETDYLNIREAWRTIKREEIANKYTALVAEKFPNGKLMLDSLSKTIMNSKDLNAAEAYFSKYSEVVGHYLRNNNDVNENRYIQFRYNQVKMAMTYKSKLAMNPDRFSFYMRQIDDDATKALRSDDFARELISKNVYLDSALSFSAYAAALTKAHLSENTDQEIVQKMVLLFAEFTATNGRAYAALGRYDHALSLLHTASIDLAKWKNLEINQYYAETLASSMSPKTVQDSIAEFINKGYSTAKMRTIFKDAYVKLNGSENGYADYLAQVGAEANKAKREFWTAQSIREKAPDFTLTTLDGKPVSLSSLKGKTIVLDFWATWCIPCIESFPGMLQAMDNYKSDPSVVFLFANTWERGDVKKNISDFLIREKGQYDQLPIVLDNENTAAKSYKASSIPQKFIIDPSGNIRFRLKGYDGMSPNAAAEELGVMIEIAKEQ